MALSRETRFRHREITSGAFKKQRLRVFARDGKVCAHCQSVEGPFHIDHIIPRSAGGGHEMDNLQVLCKPCNQAKGSKMPFFDSNLYPTFHFRSISAQVSVVFDDFGTKP